MDSDSWKEDNKKKRGNLYEGDVQYTRNGQISLVRSDSYPPFSTTPPCQNKHEAPPANFCDACLPSYLTPLWQFSEARPKVCRQATAADTAEEEEQKKQKEIGHVTILSGVRVYWGGDMYNDEQTPMFLFAAYGMGLLGGFRLAPFWFDPY